MKQLSSILILVFFVVRLLAQQCKVMPDSLQGHYSGKCKNGLANGRGTATGVDSYTGQFKDGLPDGSGKYTWKNGNWYDGEWKSGHYEGKGTLHLNGSDKAKKEFAGFWHEGIYLGTEQKPYIVNLMTNKVSEVTINKGRGSTTGDIIISVYDIINSAATFNAPNSTFLPKQKLTNIQILAGNFTNMVNDEESSHYNNIYKLYGVEYPIRLVLNFDQEQVDFEIFEKGKWDIHVKLEKMSQDVEIR